MSLGHAAAQPLIGRFMGIGVQERPYPHKIFMLLYDILLKREPLTPAPERLKPLISAQERLKPLIPELGRWRQECKVGNHRIFPIQSEDS